MTDNYPINITATALTFNSIRLTWSLRTTEEDEVLVEQSDDGVIFVEVASLARGIETYDAIGLTANQIYDFRVRIREDGVYSFYSGVVTQKTTVDIAVDPVTIEDTDENILGTEPAGGTFTVADSLITDSDGSTVVNVLAEGSFSCTPSIIPSGIRYNPVPWTGVEDIHAFNDDGWNKANGFKDYIGPSNPIYTARIDPTAPLQDTLINDNFYGNKSLWTNNIGYYFEKGTTSLNYVNGNLRDADGTVISASTISAAKVIFGDYWVNNYNRLGYYTVDGGVLGADWLDLVTVISTGTYAGFSDYRLTDFEELKSIWLQQSNSWLYAIALYKNLATVVTTSTTRVIDSGYAWAMERDGDIVPYLKNQNRGYLVRNHFN